MNKGFETEQIHYATLTKIFGEENVSKPKNSASGSDFVVNYKDAVVTFESKTNMTDRFEAGSVGCWANGVITSSSGFLRHEHIDEIQNVITSNKEQLVSYCDVVKQNKIPHRISTELYQKAKDEKRLVYIRDSNFIENAVESTLLKSNNKFVKANYVIIDQYIYGVSSNTFYDPLKLMDQGLYVLTDSNIQTSAIRSGRSATKDGKVGVTLRMQYNLFANTNLSVITLNNLKSLL